jgi:hypothetical protein
MRMTGVMAAENRIANALARPAEWLSAIEQGWIEHVGR